MQHTSLGKDCPSSRTLAPESDSLYYQEQRRLAQELHTRLFASAVGRALIEAAHQLPKRRLSTPAAAAASASSAACSSSVRTHMEEASTAKVDNLQSTVNPFTGNTQGNHKKRIKEGLEAGLPLTSWYKSLPPKDAQRLLAERVAQSTEVGTAISHIMVAQTAEERIEAARLTYLLLVRLAKNTKVEKIRDFARGFIGTQSAEIGSPAFMENYQLLKKAANANLPEAQSYLVVLSGSPEYKGIISREEADQWLKKAADLGDAYALHAMGIRYTEKGPDGKLLNRQAAKKYLELAAAQNQIYALNNLAVLLQQTATTIEQFEAILQLYKRSAELGLKTAGESYEKLRTRIEAIRAQKAEQQAAKAQRQAQKAAKAEPILQSQLRAEIVASKWYQSLPKDGSEKVTLEQRLARSFQLEEALCYLDGNRGYVTNIELSKSLFAKLESAEDPQVSGFAKAIGKVLSGASITHKEGFDSLQVLAIQGLPEAQAALGMLLEHGSASYAQDIPLAMQWYEKAVQQGDVRAALNLGTCYYDGVGMEVNCDKARQYYQIATQFNDARAWYNTGLTWEADPKGSDLVQALQCYKKADALGSVLAKAKIESFAKSVGL